MLTRRLLLAGLGVGCALPTLSQPISAAASRVKTFIAHAKAQTRERVVYDPAYRRIPYPMGDVPLNTGVCSDVVIRAYRALGIDLQQLVHEDMKAHFALYPKIWGLKRPDPNIDHRRVPNLETFFNRFAEVRARSKRPEDYQPGDLVTCRLPGNLPHIMIVSDELVFLSQNRYQIIHNVGAGPKQEDRLFSYDITGHYRYRL